MLEIFHSPGTRGLRAIWACEELNAPYQVVPVDFSPEYRASPEWRLMNPVGKVPVMRDGTMVMFESGAMVQYILDRYGDGKLQPPAGTSEHAEYLQWSWFAESTFARPLGEITNHRRAFVEPIEACVEEMRSRARLCVEALDAHLSARSFLLGDVFTGADIMMGYSLRSFCKHVPDYHFQDGVGAYFNRITTRAAYQATLAAESPAA
jgi:glutathione S-transferase